MTIDAAWVKIMKQSGSSAFSAASPIRPDVVFIDGQIRLQKAAHITTWRELVFCNFARVVQRWFSAGATRVVLAFDCYDYVSPCKAMTQAKRRKHLPVIDVDLHETLPAVMPRNYDQLIMNRTWKSKVVSLIIEFLPSMLVLNGAQTLVIDWAQHATEYTAGSETPVINQALPPLGENDVKAMRYLQYGNLVLDTTDGDFIPISLIALERLSQERCMSVQELPQVAIYRMECNISNRPGLKLDAGGADSKRRRRYEFVHVNRLYNCVRSSMHGTVSKTFMRACDAPKLRGHEMRVLALLIALTGTDFTKGMAQVSPGRVWDNLGHVWSALNECYDPETMALDPQLTADTIIARIYAIVYRNHITNNRAPMVTVAAMLKGGSSLSASVKKRLPGKENALCLVKNSNWVLQYWLCPPDGSYPDPVCPQYGYKYTKTGATTYEDE